MPSESDLNTKNLQSYMWGSGVCAIAALLGAAYAFIRCLFNRRMLIIANEEGQFMDYSCQYPVQDAVNSFCTMLGRQNWGLRRCASITLLASRDILRSTPVEHLKHIQIEEDEGAVFRRNRSGNRRHFHVVVIMGALSPELAHQLQNTVECDILVCGERATLLLQEGEKTSLYRSPRVETFVGTRNKYMITQTTAMIRRYYPAPMKRSPLSMKRTLVHAFLTNPTLFTLNCPDFRCADALRALQDWNKDEERNTDNTPLALPVAEAVSLLIGETGEREEEEEQEEEQGAAPKIPPFLDHREYTQRAEKVKLGKEQLDDKDTSTLFQILFAHMGAGLSGDDYGVARIAIAVWLMDAKGDIELPFETRRRGGYYENRATTWDVTL